MKEIIRVKPSPTTGNPIVNARELHEFLEVGKNFGNWITDRIKKYGFVENEDYARIYYDIHGNRISLTKNGKSGTQAFNRAHRIEYALTMECAKELSMVQNNDKGRQARRYFIEIEKQYRELREGKRQLYTVSEVAKLLDLSDYYGKIGRNSFYALMAHKKIVNEKNRPLQKYVDKGYFMKYPTRVTEEGLVWLTKMFPKGDNVLVEELKAVITELKEEHTVMKEGLVVLVETLYYNKGGRKTEEKNRLVMQHLRGFLDRNQGQRSLI